MKPIDPIFQAVTPAGAPGCVVGVQQGGQLLFRGAYGLASLELAVPLTPCTRFRVASVTKQFTVTALLMLAAQGRLSLDDEIHAHLPELAPLPQAVTLEHLMRNTSGLPDFLEMLRLGGVGLDASIDRAAMQRCIAGNRHLNFAPGSRFLYSNTNFLLLGLVVERIAGCSLGDFLQEHVFAHQVGHGAEFRVGGGGGVHRCPVGRCCGWVCIVPSAAASMLAVYLLPGPLP